MFKSIVLKTSFDYFVIVEKTEETDIVSIGKLIRKCIEITIDSEVYLTYCVDIEEHD